MFYVYKVAYIQYVGEVDIFSYEQKIIPVYDSAKITKID